MKTAFVYWENRIAPVFDTARWMHIVEVESGEIVGERQEPLSEEPPVHKALQLVNMGIDTLVCGAISRPIHEMAVAYGIQVIPFVAGELREVVKAWLRGELKGAAFSMPGCSGRGGGRRFRGLREDNSEVNIMNGKDGKGRGMGAGRGKGAGQGGRRVGRGAGSPGTGPIRYCVCPQCGQKEPHELGKPCIERKCPQCGTIMTRQVNDL